MCNCIDMMHSDKDLYWYVLPGLYFGGLGYFFPQKLNYIIFGINKENIKEAFIPFSPYCLLLTVLPFLQSKKYKFGSFINNRVMEVKSINFCLNT